MIKTTLIFLSLLLILSVPLFARGSEKKIEKQLCTLNQLPEEDKLFIERLVAESEYYKIYHALAAGKETINILNVETIKEIETGTGGIKNIKRINFELVIDGVTFKRFLDVSFITNITCDKLKFREKFNVFGVGFISGVAIIILMVVLL